MGERRRRLTLVDRFLEYADVQYTRTSRRWSLAILCHLKLGPDEWVASRGIHTRLAFNVLCCRVINVGNWGTDYRRSTLDWKEVSHSAGRVLLTHRNLEVLPVFGSDISFGRKKLDVLNHNGANMRRIRWLVKVLLNIHRVETWYDSINYHLFVRYCKNCVIQDQSLLIA
jgi:hypothetical protein